MADNKRCPRCGSEKVQLSQEKSKHGCWWFILFGWTFVVWRLIKMLIGLVIFVVFDWWMAIIRAILDKGYVWHSKKWFSNKKRIYYCHDCGYNFTA